MKKMICCSLIAVSAVFTGCVTANPGTTTSTTSPTGIVSTVTNPPVYVASSAPASVISNLQAGISAAAPIVETLAPASAPVFPIAQTLLAVVGTLITTISAGVAYVKNQSAASHANAAAALASVVVTNPALSNQAIANAASNNSVATVAAHLANAAKPV